MDDAERRSVFNRTFLKMGDASTAALAKFASDHDIADARDLQRPALIERLESHSCNWACLICTSDIVDAGGVLPEAAPPAAIPPNTPRDLSARTGCRHAAAAVEEETDEADKQWWVDNWPQVQSQDFLKDVCLLLHCNLICSRRTDHARTS
jgi:hypothetical protein